MVILTSVDAYCGEYFPSFSVIWVNGILCKVAAALSTLSSENSVFLILLVAMDRFLGVTYPLGVHHGLGSTRMRIFVSLSWLLSSTLSIGSVVLLTYIPSSYDICVHRTTDYQNGSCHGNTKCSFFYQARIFIRV